MTTLTVLEAPAVGARYCKNATGRTWRISKIDGSGLISIFEEHYGADCEIRGYVTDTELSSEYDALGE